MIDFTVTAEGQSLINNAVAGTSPLIIDGVAFYNNITRIKTIKSTLKGCSFNDGNGIGEYVRISVEDNSSDTYSITNIGLFSNSVLVAKSESIQFTKSNKCLLLDLYCVFNGASRCSFNNIMINIPYATTFRDGLLRLAKENDTHKDLTVYSADIVDGKINDLYDLLTDGIVTWKKEDSYYIIGTLQLDKLELVNSLNDITSKVIFTTSGKDGNVTRVNIDGHIVGEAVSSIPIIDNGIIIGSNKLINEEYISSLYANTITSSNKQKLVSSQAVQDFVTTAISNIPTVNNATLTIQRNGTNVNKFTANSSTDITANIEVPVLGVQVNGSDLTPDTTTKKVNVQIKTVNNKTITGSGNVDLTANDVGALPISTEIPTVNNKTVTIKKNSSDTGDSFTLNQSTDKSINLGLATVATSGSYNDLSNKPTIPTVNNAKLTIKKNNDDTGTEFTANASIDVTANLGLSEVATSGSYNDLINKPTIPIVNNASLTINKGGTDDTSTKTFTANASSNVTINLGLGGAANKAVDQFISNSSISTNLPTSKAVSDFVDAKGYLTQHQSLDGVVATAQYNSKDKRIEFYNLSGTKLNTDIDATVFIKDGMVDTVSITGGYLVIIFNTDAGKENIQIPISDIFDANNYYTKADINNGDYENIIDGVQVNGLDIVTDLTTKKVNIQIKTINNNSLVGTGDVYLDVGDHNVIESISVNNTPQVIINKNVDISVPTNISDLTNDSGYITYSDLPINYVTTDTSQTITAPKIISTNTSFFTKLNGDIIWVYSNSPYYSSETGTKIGSTSISLATEYATIGNSLSRTGGESSLLTFKVHSHTNSEFSYLDISDSSMYYRMGTSNSDQVKFFCSNFTFSHNTNLQPYVDSTSQNTGFDLGRSDRRWRTLYTRYIGSSLNNVTTGYINTIYSTTIGSTSEKVTNIYATNIGASGNEVAYIYATNIVASSFEKPGGTSSQFLKADGSVDSNTYALSSAIPTVNNASLTINKGGINDTTTKTFTANASSDVTINLGLGGAADKGVDTSIGSSSSTNLPTTNAVKSYVTGLGYLTSSDLPTTVDGMPIIGNIDVVHYAVCDTAANIQTKEVTITGFSLVAGARLFIRFTNGNTHYLPKLKVNNESAKDVFPSALEKYGTYVFEMGDVIEFIYNGTSFNIISNPNWSVFSYHVGYRQQSDGSLISVFTSDATTGHGKIKTFIPWNSADIGTSDNKFGSVYATTFYGDLSGNASTSTTAEGLFKTVTDDSSGETVTTTYSVSLDTTDTVKKWVFSNPIEVGNFYIGSYNHRITNFQDSLSTYIYKESGSTDKYLHILQCSYQVSFTFWDTTTNPSSYECPLSIHSDLLDSDGTLGSSNPSRVEIGVQKVYLRQSPEISFYETGNGSTGDSSTPVSKVKVESRTETIDSTDVTVYDLNTYIYNRSGNTEATPRYNIYCDSELVAFFDKNGLTITGNYGHNKHINPQFDYGLSLGTSSKQLGIIFTHNIGSYNKPVGQLYVNNIGDSNDPVISITAKSFCIPFGECNTESNVADKVVQLGAIEADITTLFSGMVILVKFKYSNTASRPRLSIDNGFTFKNIYKLGTTSAGVDAPNSWMDGEVVFLRYTGSAWNIIGHNTTALASVGTDITNIIPNETNSYNLGSTSYRWNYLYARYVGSGSYPITSIYGRLNSLYGNDVGAIFFFKLIITNNSSTDITVPRGVSLTNTTYFGSTLLSIVSYEEKVDESSSSYGTDTFTGTFYTLLRFTVTANASLTTVYVPCLRYG